MAMGLLSLITSCFKARAAHDLEPRVVAHVEGPVAADLYEVPRLEKRNGREIELVTAKVVVHRAPPVAVYFDRNRESSLRGATLLVDDKGERVAFRANHPWYRIAYLRPDGKAYFARWPAQDYVADPNAELTSMAQVPPYSLATLGAMTVETELDAFADLEQAAARDFHASAVEFLVAAAPWTPPHAYASDPPDAWEARFARLGPDEQKAVVTALRDALARGTGTPVFIGRALRHVAVDDPAIAAALPSLARTVIDSGYRLGDGMDLVKRLVEAVAKHAPAEAGSVACALFEKSRGHVEAEALETFARRMLLELRHDCP